MAIRLTDPATQNPLYVVGTIVGSYGVFGVVGTAWTVSNAGSIEGTASYGIILQSGGDVTNGSTATPASISGLTGGILIKGGAGQVLNYGAIATRSGAPQSASGVEVSGGTGVVTNHGVVFGLQDGVRLDQGGAVVNGLGRVARAATISGIAAGVGVYGKLGMVTNDGLIQGNLGVNLTAGGTIINGTIDRTTATIEGTGFGILAGLSAVSVANFGTISGSHYGGVQLFGGGSITNGSTVDTTAQIYSYLNAIKVQYSPAFIKNFGTVDANLQRGILLNNGGTVVNGASNNTAALISSKQLSAIQIVGSGTVVNYGRIAGYYAGVAFGRSTSEVVVNAGTIVSATGTAVSFGHGVDLLMVKPGAVFIGNVLGGSGSNTLEFGSGSSTGTLSGIGASFVNFGTLVVDADAKWGLAGSNSLTKTADISLGSGATLAIDGSLASPSPLALHGLGTIAVPASGAIEIGAGGHAIKGAFVIDSGAILTGNGTIASAVSLAGKGIVSGGTLSFLGAVNGAGTVSIRTGATLAVVHSFRPSISFLSGGSETLLLSKTARVTGSISGFGVVGAKDSIDLLNVKATGSAFSAGVLTVSSAGGPVKLHFAGNLAVTDFSVVSDQHNGTLITFK